MPRSIGLPGVVMIGRYHINASRRGLSPHAHRDAIEICFLERGEQTYRVGNRLYRLSGGDQFFTLPGEVHDTANFPQERGILYWLILDIKSAGNLLGLSIEYALRLQRSLGEMRNRHFRADSNSSLILSRAIKLLSDRGESRGGSPSSSLEKLQLQSLLLQYLVLTLKRSRLGAKEEASLVIQRVLQYIAENLEQPIQVSLLAKIAKLSVSRFKTRFRSEVGVPPSEFWTRQKIERASQLLQSKGVTEVAFQLGFSSSQYFATVFKRYTLHTPSSVVNPK